MGTTLPPEARGTIYDSVVLNSFAFKKEYETEEYLKSVFTSIARAFPRQTGLLVRIMLTDDTFETCRLDLHPRLRGFRLNTMQPILKDRDFETVGHVIENKSCLWTFERVAKKKL